jgi:hypothetical protein
LPLKRLEHLITVSEPQNSTTGVGVLQRIRYRFFGSLFLLVVLYIFCQLSKASIVVNAQKISMTLMVSELTDYLAALYF